MLFHVLLFVTLQLTERLKMNKWLSFEKISNLEIIDKSLIQKQFQWGMLSQDFDVIINFQIFTIGTNFMAQWVVKS